MQIRAQPRQGLTKTKTSGFDRIPKQDAENFLSLLRELRSGMDNYATSIGEQLPQSRFLVSCCLAGTMNRLEVLDLAKLGQVVDELHLMSYDFNGSWSKVAGHHANLFGGEINGDAAVNHILSRGVPPAKVILGVPMYGRAFCNTGGLGQPFQGIGEANQEKKSWEAGVWDYSALPLEGAEEHLDAQSVGAYSYDRSKRHLVSYDSPASVSAKADYVVRRGLGGMFFWELSGDKCSSKFPERSLLAAAHEGLGGRRGGVDGSPNHLNYPTSVYDNIRQGNQNAGAGARPLCAPGGPPRGAQLGQPPGPPAAPNAHCPPPPAPGWFVGPQGRGHSGGPHAPPAPPLPPRVDAGAPAGARGDSQLAGNAPFPASVRVPLPPFEPNSRPRRVIVAAEVVFDGSGGYTVKSLPSVEYDRA
ncbi:MAG: glycosyl hydrolases family 18-domain-containing protein [Olpidium bornovanus]|uniref:chitinase n=1 Tax=Olpidium bornovanus TaxID=278681 RepID=A0A8H8DEY1_9FUNG|nr:MAG: glycosyl hydrolases family 18-domain-containing protein [Olpidium bornovanus]